MTRSNASLRAIITVLILVAFVCGGAVLWAWLQSGERWRSHQMAAYTTGVALYASMQSGAQPPQNVELLPLSEADQVRVENGEIRQISGAPRAARVTVVPIRSDPADAPAGQPMTLVILSPVLVYPLSELPLGDRHTAGETIGGIFRLVTTYCSDPTVIAQMGDRPWVRIDGAAIWNCDAAPSDLRLAAGTSAVIVIAVLVGTGQSIAASFANFAQQLRNRRRLDGPRKYDTTGPRELQNIVTAVNAHLEAERAQLEARAEVLSGVSHDLGTPATRLRLRTALISDSDLRDKLEHDIDSMTGMIESVLTYTRAEMNAEEPRVLSLASLVDAIVADYQDTGCNVEQRPASEIVVRGGRSVFSAHQGRSVVVLDQQVIVMACPNFLERAICNLINNALKYGRRAIVSLEADFDYATIIVDDEGATTSAEEIEALTAPFQRGDNAASTEGYGLGLTIVSAIANLHGGELSFVDSETGVSARLSIRRA